MDSARIKNLGPAIFLISYHLFLLVTLPFYFYYSAPGLGMWAAMAIILYLTGLSITAGYHRYFSHRSYKTNKWIEGILAFFGSMATQGSILRWSFDHRIHHAHVDTDDDPYSINKGFWYAHCLWLLDNPREIDPKIVPDLMKNKLVMNQHRFYPIWMFMTNFVMFLFVGWLLNDYLGAFMLATMTRLFFLHHFTWFINSLAHTWGDKPFSQEQSAVNNYIISLLTFGEGYHNYHHTYANDYRNGVRWYHFDPTKWLIWVLNKVGLATNLRRMDPYTINKRMVLEKKNLMLDHIKDLWFVKKDELELKVHELSDHMLNKIAEFNELRKAYKEMKKQKQRDRISQIRQEIKSLKKSLKEDWRNWKQLHMNIEKLKPLPV